MRALELMGSPSFCLSFNSEDFDIYHVNDCMRERGWRLNDQQHPDSIHLCVTRPQTQPGIVEGFAEDLGSAVAFAKEAGDVMQKSGAIYGACHRRRRR